MPTTARSQPANSDRYFIDPKIELEFLIDAAITLHVLHRETISEFKQLVNQMQATRQKSAELRRAAFKTIARLADHEALISE